MYTIQEPVQIGCASGADITTCMRTVGGKGKAFLEEAESVLGLDLCAVDAVETVPAEVLACERRFYTMPRVLGRVWTSVWRRRQPLINLCANVSYRRNLRLSHKAYADFSRERGRRARPSAQRFVPDVFPTEETPAVGSRRFGT